MKFKTLFIALLFIGFTQANAQTAQKNKEPKASKVMRKAYKEAKKEDKNVLLMFSASWCGWCKRMDKNLKNEKVKDYFDKNFVTTHLIVMESKGKKHLENLGAMDILKEHKADKGGIPFWIVYNKNRKVLTNSKDEKGSNLGCPASKKEVAGFVAKLKKIAPMSLAEEAAIKDVFILKK